MKEYYQIKQINESDYNNIYVVGDIHGMFHILEKKLKKIGFNKDTDLLVATGDLVDRGKTSIEAIDYLQEKWFTSVFGNHDYKFMNLPNKGYSDLFPPEEYFDKQLKPKDVRLFKEIFSKYLAAAIQINLNNGEKLGIVHAGIGIHDSWELFTKKLSLGDYYTIERAIWDRPIAKLRMLKERIDNNDITEKQFYDFIERNRINKNFPELNDRSYVFFEEIFDFYEEKVGVPDLKALITGHNIVSSEGKVLSIANRYFIDTGAFLKEPFYNKKGEVVKPLKDNKYKLSILNIKEF